MLDYTSLPDFLALAILVFVFWSILRRRVVGQLRAWLVGWVCILGHFAVLLFAGNLSPVQTEAWILSSILLEFGGVAFIYAACRGECSQHTQWVASIGLLGTVLYIFFALGLSHPVGLLYATASLVALSAFTMLITGPAENFAERLTYAVAGFTLALLQGAAIYTGHADWGMDAIFFMVYLLSAIQCWRYFPAKTTGKFTAVIGLVAWAAVFPAGVLLEALRPSLHVQPSMWNIPKYIVAIGILLTLLEEQITRTEHLALHDALTGLPNRRLLEDRLTKAVERAERNDGRVAVLLIDLDNFKQINDNFGHPVGDEVLRVVATRLQMRIRKADTIARAGGDEFLVVVSDLLHPQGADVLAGKLMADLNEPILMGETRLQACASIGVAIYPEDGQTADELCSKADSAMYEKKRRIKE